MMIVERLSREAPQPLLDWGRGDGAIASLLGARGVRVEAFEYRDGEQLHEVLLDVESGTRAFVSGDPVALPFADEQFASVLALDMLEHVPYPERSLIELRRVLRPGGRLFVYGLPRRRSWTVTVSRGELGPHVEDSPFRRTYDRRAAVELLTHSGFRVDACVRADSLPPELESRLATRLAAAIFTASGALARVPLLDRLSSHLQIDATAL